MLEHAVEQPRKGILQHRAVRRLGLESPVQRFEVVLWRDRHAEGPILVLANAVGSLQHGAHPLQQLALLVP